MIKKYKLFMRKDEHGFTCVEVLVSLLCISLTTILLTQCVTILKQLSVYQYHSEDRIAIHQLRLLLALATKFQIVDGILYFTFVNEENRLEFHNQRLVRRPGYEIFLQDITKVQLIKKGRCYEIEWEREKIQKQALLVCE